MKYRAIFFFAVFCSLSCNKLLEISPGRYTATTETYYSNQAQLDIALRGVYAILAEGSLYGNNMIARMGLGADEYFCELVNDQGTVTYNAVNAADVKIFNYWKNLYAGINRANLILSRIDDPSIDIDSEIRKSFKGEALFLRGYFYFMLANRFGGVPLVTSPAETPASGEVQIRRSSLKEIYDHILNDMTESADLVRDISKVESGGRVSKSAVWGMLARVCLYMAGSPLNDKSKYQEVVTWTQKVSDLEYHELNPSYQQVFVNYAQDKYDKKESIFEVEFYGNATGVYTNTTGYVGIHNGIRYPSTGTGGHGYSNGIAHPSQWLYEIYESGDLRRDWTIAPYRYVADTISGWPATSSIHQRYCGKFRRENEILLPKSTAATPQNFPILRYSDILLMYAEASNELDNGPSANAYSAVNQVRRRGWGLDPNTPNPEVDLSAMNYSRFKLELKMERARELAFELLRKDDVVRWGDFYANMQRGLSDAPAGTGAFANAARVYFNNATPRDVIWPIPLYELGVNPMLEQNSGW